MPRGKTVGVLELPDSCGSGCAARWFLRGREAGQDMEDRHAFHVEVTDGQRAWAADVSPPDVSVLRSKEQWAQTAREALAPACPAAAAKARSTYTYSFARTTGQLRVQWKWGKEGFKSHVLLEELQPAARRECIAGVMGFLVRENASLWESNARLQEVSSRLQAAQKQGGAALGEAAEQQAQREADLYRKFAMVLNEKKRAYRELLTRVEELESRGAGSHATGSADRSCSSGGGHTGTEPDEAASGDGTPGPACSPAHSPPGGSPACHTLGVARQAVGRGTSPVSPASPWGGKPSQDPCAAAVEPGTDGGLWSQARTLLEADTLPLDGAAAAAAAQEGEAPRGHAVDAYASQPPPRAKPPGPALDRDAGVTLLPTGSGQEPPSKASGLKVRRKRYR
eukprot:jgi/Tetstr1/424213/TSEL_014818.t1